MGLDCQDNGPSCAGATSAAASVRGAGGVADKESTMSEARPVRIGFIGAGMIGQVH